MAKPSFEKDNSDIFNPKKWGSEWFTPFIRVGSEYNSATGVRTHFEAVVQYFSHDVTGYHYKSSSHIKYNDSTVTRKLNR